MPSQSRRCLYSEPKWKHIPTSYSYRCTFRLRYTALHSTLHKFTIKDTIPEVKSIREKSLIIFRWESLRVYSHTVTQSHSHTVTQPHSHTAHQQLKSSVHFLMSFNFMKLVKNRTSLNRYCAYTILNRIILCFNLPM